MLSFKGRCFTYDVSADGYLRGEAGSLCAAFAPLLVSVPLSPRAKGVSSIFLELKEFGREACQQRAQGWLLGTRSRHRLGLHGPLCYKMYNGTGGEVLPWLQKEGIQE